MVQAEEKAALGPDEVRIVSSFLRAQTGIQLGESKKYLIESRLAGVARRHGFASVAQLCRALEQENGTPLGVEVVDSLTTNETSWFRDRKPFDALAYRILPEIAARKRDRQLRVWSAACSTGQEPYSLAMLIHENGGFEHWMVRILATDVSHSALTQARKGQYSTLEMNRGLPKKYLEAYFTSEENGEWRVLPVIRQMVEFRFHRLQDSPDTPGTFDLIFCRNALIYFDLENKRRVLHNMYRALHPDGLLCLGGSESTFGITDAFEAVHIADATFYRRRSRW